MKQIITTPSQDVIIPPKAKLSPEAIEVKFGLETTHPPQLTLAVAERHTQLIPIARRAEIKLEFVGYRKPLHGIETTTDEQNESNWAVMPIEMDRLASEGLQTPRNIQRNLDRADRSGLFDAYYIAHAWPVEEQTSSTLALRSEVSPDALPWDKMGSPAMRRLDNLFDGTGKVEEAIGRGLLQLIHGTEKGVKFLLLGALTIGVAALVIAVAVAVISMVIAAIVAVGSTVLVIGAIGMLGAGVDPIVYGIVYERDSNGNDISMWYKLGQWDMD